MEVTCSIVDVNRKPVYHALVFVDGQALQLSGNSFRITTGQHAITVMHRGFVTAEGQHNVIADFAIVLAPS
jgi:hypothetical protein